MPSDWPAKEFALAMILVLGLEALFRLFIYCVPYRPPINLLGRLATGRLIIPGYDKVFVSPLAAAVGVPLLAWQLTGLGLPAKLVMPVAAAAGLYLVLAGPPLYPDWHLTGHHRHVGSVS